MPHRGTGKRQFPFKESDPEISSNMISIIVLLLGRVFNLLGGHYGSLQDLRCEQPPLQPSGQLETPVKSKKTPQTYFQFCDENRKWFFFSFNRCLKLLRVLQGKL